MFHKSFIPSLTICLYYSLFISFVDVFPTSTVLSVAALRYPIIKLLYIIKKNSIIIVEGNVNHRFCNINARTIKIAVKKVVDTEDMDIPEYSRKEESTVSEEPEDILKTMFGM